MARQKDKNPVQHTVLSDRGVHLGQAHERQQNSNIRHGQPVVIGQNDDGADIVVKIGQKCPVCNKRVRGVNHTGGDHHRKTVKRCGR